MGDNSIRFITSWDHQDEDGYGGTIWSVWETSLDDAEIERWIDGRFDSERCVHEHDCCGNRYHRRAKWSRHLTCLGVTQVVLSRGYIFNV